MLLIKFLCLVSVGALSLVNALGPNARPQDHISIQQTLARYPLAIDSKNFASLVNVFTPDAVADFSPPVGVANGVTDIERVIETALRYVTTQHALSTQVIDFSDRDRANSTTYFKAAHFGMARYEGQVLYAYGQYRDELARVGRRAEGEWRVSRRKLVYMGPLIGNLSVFTPS